MSKVTAHYDEAYRSIKAEMAKIVAIEARGGTSNVDINDVNDWIDVVVNPEGRTAPKGSGNAYVSGSSPSGDDGEIGITASAGVVTVYQPAFLELNAANIEIDFSEM